MFGSWRSIMGLTIVGVVKQALLYDVHQDGRRSSTSEPRLGPPPTAALRRALPSVSLIDHRSGRAPPLAEPLSKRLSILLQAKRSRLLRVLHAWRSASSVAPFARQLVGDT